MARKITLEELALELARWNGYKEIPRHERDYYFAFAKYVAKVLNVKLGERQPSKGGE